MDLLRPWKPRRGSQQPLNSFDLNCLHAMSLNNCRNYRKHRIWRKPNFAGTLRRQTCADKEYNFELWRNSHHFGPWNQWRLCAAGYNFFRRKCNDANCKFAHGRGSQFLFTFTTLTLTVQFGVVRSENWITRYGELRATDTVFKTELCRWWANGSCKAFLFLFSNSTI